MILHDEKPVFVQIIEMIEDDILSGAYGADELIISTPQISKLLSVNPATAQRAIGVLTDRGIIYKKRGVGMAVAPAAKEQLLAGRRAAFFEKVVPKFVSGAKKIGILGDELVKILKESIND
ncbi:MAG: GntR family transcriptional regulator [Gracilibacteraceae bacterium]|jgi:DNA-binding transcriptional regulator YhcF (GntR family)|nr:GntR family transcriptional regulator [Gracilibacteraceae bacterium]